MMRDLVDFYNIATYTIVATSAGILFRYFSQHICIVKSFTYTILLSQFSLYEM